MCYAVDFAMGPIVRSSSSMKAFLPCPFIPCSAALCFACLVLAQEEEGARLWDAAPARTLWKDDEEEGGDEDEEEEGETGDEEGMTEDGSAQDSGAEPEPEEEINPREWRAHPDTDEVSSDGGGDARPSLT